MTGAAAGRAAAGGAPHPLAAVPAGAAARAGYGPPAPDAGRPRDYTTLLPYISPSGSAISSRRVPSGSRKYIELPLARW